MGQSITITLETFEGFEIEHCKRQEPCSMDLYHYHGSFEIYYLLSGTRNYFIKDRVYRIEKGDVVLINRQDLHKTTYGGSSFHERILINFDEAFIGGMLPVVKDIDLWQPFRQGIHVLKLNKSERVMMEQALFRIMKEARERSAGAETCVRLLLLELLIFIARRAVMPESGLVEQHNPMYEKISCIVKHINSNYKDRLTLQSLAGTFYISPGYLSRLFKNVTGFTFVEYLNSVRIKEAQRLLKDTKYNMGEIAERTGYESTTHFGRVFREITGVAPLRYRKLNKE